MRPPAICGVLVAALTAGAFAASNLLVAASAGDVRGSTPTSRAAVAPPADGALVAARRLRLDPSPPPPRMGPTLPDRVGPTVPPTAVAAARKRAPAPTRPTGRGSRSRAAAGTPAQIGRAALAALSYDVSRTGFRVEFRPGRPGLLGQTFLEERIIRIYVRPGQSVQQVTRVLAHEVGHAVDVAFMSPRSRDQWLAARGAPGTRWWPNADVSDFSSGAGDFAEVFARWALGGQTRFRSTVAPAPPQARLAELAERFFQRTARGRP